MAYIAKKVCNFGGREFLIGDPVPDELIHPGRVADLVKLGVITEASPVPKIGQVTFPVNVKTDSGDLVLDMTSDDVQQFVDVLHSNTDGAKAIVQKTESENVLILLDIIETRKGVKAAVSERASELFPQGE